MTPATRFSSIVGTFTIGARFFERASLVRAGGVAPKGVVDRLEDLAHPGVAIERVPPAIRAFFEDTASLDLLIRSRWHPVARVFWRLLRPIFARIGQLALPVDGAHIRTTMVALDTERDGRAGARGVVRTEVETGETMQVFAYATCVTDGVALMSVTIPWPLGHLAGMLRVDPLDDRDEGPIPIALTSRRRRKRRDTTGVWFVRRGLAVPMPLEETIRFWAADMRDAPVPWAEREWTDATVIARHEQRLFGWRVVEHTYLFRPLAR